MGERPRQATLLQQPSLPCAMQQLSGSHPSHLIRPHSNPTEVQEETTMPSLQKGN